MRELDYNLPFFAYGIFRPGEISFLGIEDYVESAVPASIIGRLKMWDGVLVYTGKGTEQINGYIVTFKKEDAKKAYDFIESIESTATTVKIDDGKVWNKYPLYAWDVETVGAQEVNVLKKSDCNYANFSEAYEDSMWNDPYFNVEGKDTVFGLLKQYLPPKEKMSYKSIFDLQMHYLLLWTVVERFVFFRYGKGKSINESLRKLDCNAYFNSKIKKLANDKKKRIIYSSDEGNRIKYDLKPTMYYHQLRNNAIHRGKGLSADSRDYELLSNSLRELLDIMEHVLRETKQECVKVKEQYDGKETERN